MLIPKKTKYIKSQKLKVHGKKRNGNLLHFGNYGLQTLKAGRITQFQLEACRKFLNKKLKRHGKVWINIFPHWPVTTKAIGTRMGKGKGNVTFWICKVKENKILFEIQTSSHEVAKEALNGAALKLPLPTQIIF